MLERKLDQVARGLAAFAFDELCCAGGEFQAP
jgi:hypothetical protein